MEYPAFITAFDTLVESKVKDPTELLYYLAQFTTGKAKEVIKGCFQRKSESSYTEARALLKKHFGDSFKIANAYVTKLSGWPSIKPNDGAKLQEFAIMLQQAKTAMTGMDYMGDLNTAHVMRQLWEKLPHHLRSKWCERANSIKVTSKQMASFKDLVEFVTRQAELATDPIYSEELVPKDNSSGIQKRRYRGSSFVTGSKEEGIHPSKCNDLPCAVCQKMHNIDKCIEFKKQTLAQRKNFMRMKGMCFSCYSQGHIAKFCKQRKTCLICKKQHPTALHDPQWKPQNKPDKEKEEKGPSRVDPESKPVDNRVNNSRATVCDITEAGDAPINMGIIPVWLYHKDNPERKVAVYALLDSASGGTFIKEGTER
jgi:predicted Zn-dependent protease